MSNVQLPQQLEDTFMFIINQQNQYPASLRQQKTG